MNKSLRIKRLSQTLLMLVCLSLGLAGAAWGQVSGALTGVVTDPSGAVIPGAKVTLTDVGKNTEFPALTDAEGRYVIRALPPSTYRLRVEASGFSTYVQDNIVLAVNQSSSVAVQLKVGATSEVIEVTSGAALLSTQDASTGQEIQRSYINELPLLGRGVYDLVNLATGVTQVQGGYIGGGTANNFISNGSRNVQADIIADGATTTNFEQNTGIQTSMYSPSVDMVQEFKLQQSNFSAEMGFSGSTIINLVTRSGTNDFHGTGWWFVRRNGLTANNWYANAGGVPLAPRKYNLFGANGGGPIIKDKLFFFFNYEGLRDKSATTYTAGVPSPAMKKGDFGELCTAGFDASGKCKSEDGQIWDPYSGVYSSAEGGPVRSLYIPFNNMATYQSPGSPKLPAGHQLPPVPGNLIDPVASKIMNYFPDPNVKVGQPDYNRFNNWVGAGSRNGTNNMYDTKIDWNIGPSDVLSAKYSISPGVGSAGEVWPGTSNAYMSGINGPSKNKNQIFSMNYNHTFSPSTILTTTLGWARNSYNRADTIANVPGYDPVADLGLPEYTLRSGFLTTPAIYLDDYTGQPCCGNIGSQPWGIMRQATETYHLVSTLSKVKGKHELRMGGEGRLHYLNYAQPCEPNGVYDFNRYGVSEHPWWGGGDTMASFLTGGDTSGWGGYEVPVFGATASWQFAGFVQDNWKITPKLTLNLGVRYDLNTPRTERFDRGSYWDPNATSPLAGKVPGLPNLTGAVAFIDSSDRHYFSYDKNNWAPRFGFAYQFRPKTVFRGGYGLFYSIVVTGASGVGSGFQGFSQGTGWVTTYQGDGATPWSRMSNPFPNGGPLLPIGSSQGASSFLGDGFGGAPMKSLVQATPYEQTWTLGIQHELPGNIVLDANYVGKKGTKLYFGGAGDLNHLGPEIESYSAAQIEDLNSYVPNPFYGLLPPGAPMDTPTVQKSQLMRPYPQYTGVSLLTLPVANSSYHAFQLRVEKRFSKGLQFLVAYTYQKSIDDSSVGHGGLTWLGGSTSLQDPNKRYLERSLSQYDIPQVLNISYVYHFPFGRGKTFGANWSPWLDAFLGGWKTNGIWRFSAGQPLALYLSGGQSLPTYGGQRPNLTGTLEKNTGADWKEQYFANPEVVVKPAPYALSNAARTIGSVRTPGINSANLSILKDVYINKIREGTRFEFRSEFFNAFNHPIFCGPNTTLGGGQFGQVSNTCNSPREVQLALKFYW